VRWEATTTSTVTLDFSAAPSSNSVRVSIYSAVAGSTITISSIDDLGDVTITSASNGQFLSWNGTNWVNANAPAAAGSGGDSLSIFLLMGA